MNDLLQGINVFLIGMMGVGKTTIGHLLAEKLGYRFVDTDVLIEKVAGKTINEIFYDDGEESFRELEAQVLSNLSAYRKFVIATGGGIVIRQLNWSYLHHGLVIWLDAPVEVLLDRLQDDTTRPLLQTPNPAQALQTLLDQRRSRYAEADLHIPVTAEDTPEQLISRVMADMPTVLRPRSVAPFTDSETSK